MKKILVSIFASAMALTGFAGGYKIVVGMPDVSLNNATAYLTSYDSGDTVATATVHGKRCVIKGKIEDSFFARLIIDGKRCGMMVEDGEIKVDWATKVASGAPLNDYLNNFEKTLETASSEEELAGAFYKAFEENKTNGIGPWAFYNYLMCKPLTLPQLEAELANVPASYADLKRVKSAINNVKAQARTAEGQMYTDFTVTREDGSTVKLSDYVGKGTYTVVDFWASWCGPCRREIPNLKALYEKYNGKGVSFLGVAVWDAPADTHKAIKQLDMPWPVIVGNKKLTEPTDLYGIMGIPHIIVFDPEGRIISRGLQGQKLAEKVDACMAK
ncbi:MAG: TlpA disulfide reductase family protein [Bacteroidales bacterium]|nr:TlpA disulfide reductase family protein [Bacteroidales bacterium]